MDLSGQGDVPRFSSTTTKQLSCADTAVGAQSLLAGRKASLKTLLLPLTLQKTSIRGIDTLVNSYSNFNCLARKFKIAALGSGQIYLYFSEAFDSLIKSYLKD